jgi:hypothetical protein
MVPATAPLRAGARRYGYSLIVGIFFGSLIQTQAHARGPEVQTIASDARGLTLEITFPSAEVRALPATRSAWQEVSVEGLSTDHVPGRPALPRYGVLMGIPEGAEPTLTVLDSTAQERRGVRIAPTTIFPDEDPLSSAQRLERSADAAIYSSDAWYPSSPVSPGFKGRLRGQAVAQILFSPALFNPVRGSLRTYQRLRVRVDFGADLGTSDSSRQAMAIGQHRADPFETVLRGSLINYPQLGR